MALYGVLKSATNTGIDSELSSVFATPLSVTSKNANKFSETLSLRRITSASSAQRWEIEAVMAPEQNNASAIVASVLCGSSSLCYIRMPQPPNIVATGAPTLSATATKGTQVVSYTGGSIPVGSFIQLGVHSAHTDNRKVYLVTESSASQLTVFPPLNSTKASGLSIVINEKVTMYGLLDNNNVSGITYSDGILSSMGTIRVVEALR